MSAKDSITRVGFTGTSNVPTPHQVRSLCLEFAILRPTVQFHHGDCIGADEMSHGIAHELGFWIVVHPPIIQAKRAFCLGNEHRPARDYLDRNHDIVDETDWLIAMPETFVEQLRSGTWSTVRYALRRHKPILMIYPDGKREDA